jgi:hypothetical protein
MFKKRGKEANGGGKWKDEDESAAACWHFHQIRRTDVEENKKVKTK